MAKHTPIVPEYLRIAELLRNDIKSCYKPGDRYPSQNELSRRHNVSCCTITGALAELVEEGWLRRERGRGSFVTIPPISEENEAAHEVIGVLMNGHQADIEYSPFMADIGKYLIRSANLAGYSVQFLPSKGLCNVRWRNFCDGLRLAGLICFNPCAIAEEPLRALVARQPVMFSEKIEIRFPEAEPTSWCDFDTEAGVRLGLEHLLAHGCRRIALVIGNRQKFPLYSKRLESYRRTLERTGISYDENLIYEAEYFSNAAGGTAMEKLLPQKPDALLIASASFGIGAINAILSHGLRIPEDISVIGYDEQLYFAPAFQCLSCIEVPIREFAEVLVGNLIAMIQNGTPASERMFQPYLQQGKSVK